MPLALAEAICPSAPYIASAQPERDIVWLYRLARWALKFSPLVALDNAIVEAARSHEYASLSHVHYGLLIDITGTDRVHGGERNILARMQRAFSARALTARYAISPSIGASWAHAHYGPQPITIIEDQPDTKALLEKSLAPLPIEALRLTVPDTDGLRALGITSIETLLKLPLSKLSLRFPHAQAPHGILTRIRQALGTQYETLSFIHPKKSISARRRFDIPLTSPTTIQTVLLSLLDDVFQQLTRERKNTRCLVIELRGLTPDRAPLTIRKELTLCHATRDRVHARAVVAPLVESIRSVDGITDLSVTARLTSNVHAQQKTLIASQEAAQSVAPSQQVGELLNHLLARCGADSVQRLCLHSSHIPEHSFSFESIMHIPEPRLDDASSGAHSVFNGPIHNRPSMLFDAPQPIGVVALLPDRPPSQLIWNGQRMRVIQAEGPERICFEWWHQSLNAPPSRVASGPYPNVASAPYQNVASAPASAEAPHTRDYFKLQDEQGRWLWVYRASAHGASSSPPEWFVHGMWA